MAEVMCANCGETRNGAYCSRCGQSYRDYRRSLPPMLSELLREAFELDGRIVRSLNLLLFKPGALSLAFSENRRADFVSPIRLYIFASLVFFFFFTQAAELPAAGGINPQVTVVIEQSADQDKTAAFKQIVGPERAAQVDEILAREGTFSQRVLLGIIDEHDGEAHVGAVWAFLYGQIVASLADPTETARGFLENAPLALFFLLPVYALMLKVLYIRSRRYYVEHLVFALHLHAFAFLIVTLTMLLPSTLVWLKNLLLLGLMVYYFLALRRYYGQSRRKTLFKYTLLVVGYSAMTIPSLLGMVAVTVTLL